MTAKYYLIFKNLRKAFPVILTFIFFISAAQAFAADVDPAFNPLLTKDMTSNYSGNVLLQPDGKTIVYGVFESGGTYLLRYNADGTPDNSFDGSITGTTNISNALLMPNGKIMFAGFTDVPKVYRLNSDGTLDTSFNANVSTGGLALPSAIEVLGVQGDKVIVRRRSHDSFGYDLQQIFRLNGDGSNDNSFTAMGYGPARFSHQEYSKVLVLPNGKILVGGIFYSSIPSNGFLERYNSDGTRDSSFGAPGFSDTSTGNERSAVGQFDVFPDGSIIVPGRFNTVNSVAKRDLVKLAPEGNVDLTFFPDTLFDPSDTYGGKAKVLPNGQILVSTIFQTDMNGLFRFNANGSLDNTFNTPVGLTWVGSWNLDEASRIVIFGILSGNKRYLRLNADVTLDASFNPVIIKRGSISVLAVQTDGKILAHGDFNRIGGTLKNNFARINADGTLDPSFDAGTGFDVAPALLVLQPDGKIIATGDFTSYNGLSVVRIARLNSNGSLDNTFLPDFNSPPNSVVPLASGKVLAGGGFTTVNGINQRNLAQLNSDGSLDTLFAPIFGNGSVNSVLAESGGKITVAGSFTGVNGFSRQNIVRLNADGTLDASFNAGSIGSIKKVFRQSDGKYLTLQGNASLSRLNSDGTSDASFISPAIGGTVNSIVVQSNGGILAGGAFSSPKNNLARFLPNGSSDPNFIPAGTNNTVYALAGDSGGNILVGGNFSSIGEASRSGLARVSFTTVPAGKLFDYDGDGKADVSVFRPSENKWYVLKSSNLTVQQQVFAIAGDIPVPADYDGDGKTDFAIFRPSTGDWWSLSSQTGGQVYAHWGANGDIPRPSDFDGDGRADYVVFRPATSFWYRISSGNGASSNAAFGVAGDKPVTGDFDGDGKSDKAIFRPSTGDWWYQSSLNGAQLAVHWGISTDIPAPADFDGDGKTDFAVYRPSTGVWYIINSSNFSFTIMHFGIAEDKPVPGDYDGDGKADIAVYRPSTGAWYLQQSSGGFWGLSFGISTDIPTENAFVP